MDWICAVILRGAVMICEPTAYFATADACWAAARSYAGRLGGGEPRCSPRRVYRPGRS